MVVAELILDLRPAILTELLTLTTVLNPVRLIAGDWAFADTGSITNTRPITNTGTITNARSIADTGSVTNTGSISACRERACAGSAESAAFEKVGHCGSAEAGSCYGAQPAAR